MIIVHIGTNDMYASNSTARARASGNLLDKLTTGMPNALIVVAKIIPFPNAAQYNASSPASSSRGSTQGKHIIIVDLWTGFPSSGMDAVHPYMSGYNWMGDKFYESVSSLLPK